MCKLTRKQIIFLAVYPIIHILISIPFFFMMLCTGIMPEGPIHPIKAIIAKAGGYAILVLWGPALFVPKLMRFPSGVCDYLWIALGGLFYAAVFLVLYKSFRHK